MDIPGEILIAIASELSGQDLGKFRLANSQCARAGISFIARNGISILNTATCMKELIRLTECKAIADTIRELTFVHCEWPTCSRSEWEIHPLLLGGNDRSLSGARREEAFNDYSRFITEEQGRRQHEDVETFFHALTLLPKLTAVTISHVQLFHWHPSYNLKYQILQERIWLCPYLIDSIEPALQTFLLAFGSEFSNITSLTVQGAFNPAELHLNFEMTHFPSIQKLHISSLVIIQNEEMVQQFLLAFPNLVDLSMSFHGWGPSVPIIIGDIVWPQLKKLYLGDLWASEQEIFSTFSNHIQSLESFTLSKALLTQGSWRSLFTRLRELDSPALVTADGELYGRRRCDSIVFTGSQDSAENLQRFLQDRNAPWPFDTVVH
jgi:hypothetical protein